MMKTRPTALLVVVLVTIAAMMPVAQGWPDWGNLFGHRPIEPDLVLEDVRLAGRVAGENIEFDLGARVRANARDQEAALISGDVVLTRPETVPDGWRFSYRPDRSEYRVCWEKRGDYDLDIGFAARPTKSEDGAWREVQFALPGSTARRLELTCDRTDLEVRFPGALRVEREVRDGSLVLTAVLTAGRPFVVRWKPQVEEMTARLVLSCTGNTVVTASSGALRMDALLTFAVAQGEMREIRLRPPTGWSVVQIQGDHIQDWQSVQAPDAQPELRVVLNRNVTGEYQLHAVCERTLAVFPCEVEVPVIEPLGCIRADGYLALGTDSALQLRVTRVDRMSQIDAAAFPRVSSDVARATVPEAKAFFYVYAACPSSLTCSLDELTPSMDVAERTVIRVAEDDVTAEVELELDVRDAPIRDLRLDVPDGTTVSELTGAEVADYRVATEPGTAAGNAVVTVHFRDAIQGRVLLRLRLERGRSPIGETVEIAGVVVPTAHATRGYLVVAAGDDVLLEAPEVQGLREVHTGSLPMRVPEAQFAYRFRDPGWQLRFDVSSRPTAVRAELFNLVSIGDDVVYGSAVASYFITGAPVDELWLRLGDGLENIEFLGRDIRRWSRDPAGDVWRVKLQRKVIGDYNLGLTYMQRLGEGGELPLGSVSCDGVETQTVFVTVASHRNLRLEQGTAPGGDVLSIDRAEIPANYRLLINAPVLASFKSVQAPPPFTVRVLAYERGEVLDSLIEYMDLSTEIGLREGGEAEAVTRARFKVKNSSQQFLALRLPEGARAWSVRLMPGTEAPAPGHEAMSGRELAARQAGDLYLVPLERPRDPNEPLSIELEYGQVLGELQSDRAFTLTAPEPQLPATFYSWEVKVPEDWTVTPGADSTMSVSGPPAAPAGMAIAQLGAAILGCWVKAGEILAQGIRPLLVLCASAVVLGAYVLLRALRRPEWSRRLLALVLVAAIGTAGLLAAAEALRGGLSRAGLPQRLEFSQAVAAGQGSVTVDLVLSPAWRGRANLMLCTGLAVAGMAALATGVFLRRARPLLLPLGLALAASAAVPLPAMRPVLILLFTVGVPTLWALRILTRAVISCRTALVARAATATLAVLMFLGAGRPARAEVVGVHAPVAPAATEAQVEEPPEPPSPAVTAVRSVTCGATVEKDCVDVRLSLSVVCEEAPLEIPLFDDSFALLSERRVAENVALERRGGQAVLVVQRQGEYEVTVHALGPLRDTGESSARNGCRIPLPAAIRNLVRLSLPYDALEVTPTDAVRFEVVESTGATEVKAMFGVGTPAEFSWKPRVRNVELEDTDFFAEITSLYLADSGTVEARHRLRFQVVQGALREVWVRTPDQETVTAVSGPTIGAWRFDPATSTLEVRFGDRVSGEYVLDLATQRSTSGTPYDLQIGVVDVRDARRQRGIVGAMASAGVHSEEVEVHQPMNIADFAREAQPLLRDSRAFAGAELRHACRYQDRPEQGILDLRVTEVEPELRSTEQATFSVSDERLVYNAEWAVTVAKAGVFSMVMELPTGYDIDVLSGPEISHWDDLETEAGAVSADAQGNRRVTLHLRRRLTGTVQMQLTLSRAVSELLPDLDVPRIRVPLTLKHTGQVVVSAERGVRLAIRERSGVTEIDTVELGIRDQGTLAFRVLNPEWRVRLETEVLQPRTIVEGLHLAAVSDGLVRHVHELRLNVHNAGIKLIRMRVPEDVLGLLIEGPDVAHMAAAPDAPELWTLELNRKWFDRPYPLKVSYEAAFSREEGDIPVSPVVVLDAELQRGYVVVDTTERVELSLVSASESLQPAEARSIPPAFGRNDLSGAALCFRSVAADYSLGLRAVRHEAADLLDAEVLGMDLSTVVTESGSTLNRVLLQLRVGAKRRLRMQLPAGSEVWSLFVNRRSSVPSLATDGGDGQVIVPLGSAAFSELPVSVDLVYACAAAPEWGAGEQAYTGPRIDLPLRNVVWSLFVPPGYDCRDFGGTLDLVEEGLFSSVTGSFDLVSYEKEVVRNTQEDRKLAVTLQSQAAELASAGKQYAARQALESAWNYSLSDQALNEDARVQLHRLNREQAMVGLIGRRDHLRQAGGTVMPGAAGLNLGEHFNVQQAEDLQNMLTKDDSENLETITERIIEVQEAASSGSMQLLVNLPERGQRFELRRSLQVKADAPMEVTFMAAPRHEKRVWAIFPWGVGAFLAFLLPFGWGWRTRESEASASAAAHTVEES